MTAKVAVALPPKDETIRIVEARLGVPVVSSSPAGFWNLLRVAGLDSRAPGNGRLVDL